MRKCICQCTCVSVCMCTRCVKVPYMIAVCTSLCPTQLSWLHTQSQSRRPVLLLLLRLSCFATRVGKCTVAGCCAASFGMGPPPRRSEPVCWLQVRRSAAHQPSTTRLWQQNASASRNVRIETPNKRQNVPHLLIVTKVAFGVPRSRECHTVPDRCVGLCIHGMLWDVPHGGILHTRNTHQSSPNESTILFVSLLESTAPGCRCTP
jgi:hypothetical protein